MQLLVIEHLNCKLYYQQLHLKYRCNLANHRLKAPWGWHDSVGTCRSVIICEIIVHLLVKVQNNKFKKKLHGSWCKMLKFHKAVRILGWLKELRKYFCYWTSSSKLSYESQSWLRHNYRCAEMKHDKAPLGVVAWLQQEVRGNYKYIMIITLCPLLNPVHLYHLLKSKSVNSNSYTPVYSLYAFNMRYSNFRMPVLQ